MSNNELLEALTILEQEKNIPKETLLDAIENSLITACKNHFGKSDRLILKPVNITFIRKKQLWKRWRIRLRRSALPMRK